MFLRSRKERTALKLIVLLKDLELEEDKGEVNNNEGGEQDGDAHMKEADEPALTDLFNAPNPSNAPKSKKSGKGINAIISRLQKTKQEGTNLSVYLKNFRTF